MRSGQPYPATRMKSNRMKISNETKVGVLTITALTLLVLGFNFLKGKDLFNRSEKIYAVFKDIGALAKSNEVKINGFVIGKVYQLKAVDKDISGTIAVINLSQEVNIPDNSQAYISTPLVGGSIIVIERGDSKTFLKPGDTLHTRKDAGILDDVKAQMNPTLNKVRNTLDSLNEVFASIKQMLNADTRNSLQAVLLNLKVSTASLNAILDQNGPLYRTLNNAGSISENLKKNNDSINEIISNAKMLTYKLSKLDLTGTVDTLKTAIGEFRTTLTKVTDPHGTLGLLMSDPKLYNKINDVMLAAEILVDDLRTHPKRYVNLSIFGKKDKTGPLTSPAKKDTLPSGGN